LTGGGVYLSATDAFNHGTLDGMSRCLKANVNDAGVCLLIDNNMANEEKQKQFNLPAELEGKKFRIRKLTPRECFRLMGVDDEDIDKIQAADIANSSQYKLAGNSIVVDVLYHIFRKMFIERGTDGGWGDQMSIFSSTGDGEEIYYTRGNPLRVVTLCSGYDSQCLALERLKRDYPAFDYTLVAWSEFDPESKRPLHKQPAVIAHNALFPQWADRNLGDMTKIDWTQVPDFDLLFYSTPCQSISAAGLQHGFTEGSGTRSSIIWNVRDAIRIKQPRYACLENVKAMVSKKFLPMFNLWQAELAKHGYTNHPQVLNAKDYGVPQNRERIFLVSILGENQPYNFPTKMPLELRLKDVLQPPEEVEEKYYISDKMLEGFVRTSQDKSHNHNFNPSDGGERLCDKDGAGPAGGRQLHQGRVNSSQDGVVVSPEGVSPCHSAGHGNQPKVIEQ
jgi:DNA (cytosine-5)-methyltransferase 1